MSLQVIASSCNNLVMYEDYSKSVMEILPFRADGKWHALARECQWINSWFAGDLCCLYLSALRWRRNGHDGVSNHQPHDCLPNCLFRHRSKKTSKLCVIGLCAGNSPGTGDDVIMAIHRENVARHGLNKNSFRPVIRSFDASFLLAPEFCWTKREVVSDLR